MDRPMNREEWCEFGKNRIETFLQKAAALPLGREWGNLYRQNTKRCEAIVTGFRRQEEVQQYTDHGPLHIQAVKGLACAILEARGLWRFADHTGSVALESRDIFALLIACNVHDAKMAILGRKKHEELSSSDLASVFLVTDGRLAERVQQVSALHSSKPSRSFDYYLKGDSEEKRVALLGATLRFADCLDCTKDRVGLFWLILQHIYAPILEEQRKQIQADAWQYQIQHVSIDSNAITIRAQKSLRNVRWQLSTTGGETADLEMKIRDEIEEKELKPCNVVFIQCGCGSFAEGLKVTVDPNVMSHTIEDLLCGPRKSPRIPKNAPHEAAHPPDSVASVDPMLTTVTPTMGSLGDFSDMVVDYETFFEEFNNDRTRIFAIAFLCKATWKQAEGMPLYEVFYEDLVEQVKILCHLNRVPVPTVFKSLPSAFSDGSKNEWNMIRKAGKSSGYRIYSFDSRFMPYLIWMAEDCFWKLPGNYVGVAELGQDLPRRGRIHPKRGKVEFSDFWSKIAVNAKPILGAFLSKEVRDEDVSPPGIKSLEFDQILSLSENHSQAGRLQRKNNKSVSKRLAGTISTFSWAMENEAGLVWKGRKTGKGSQGRVYHIWADTLHDIRQTLEAEHWVIPEGF